MAETGKRRGSDPRSAMSDADYQLRRLQRRAELFDEIAATDPQFEREAAEAAAMARADAERMRQRGESP